MSVALWSTEFDFLVVLPKESVLRLFVEFALIL